MDGNWSEKRRYIRHPADVPIYVSSPVSLPDKERALSNISFGGLCFSSEVPFEYGTVIAIKISYVRPPFEARGRVVWCARKAASFDVGVEFDGEGDAFRARMVEQVCRIERYKEEVLKNEGRELTGTQAALEWINKYAEKFPENK